MIRGGAPIDESTKYSYDGTVIVFFFDELAVGRGRCKDTWAGKSGGNSEQDKNTGEEEEKTGDVGMDGCEELVLASREMHAHGRQWL